MPKYSTLVNFDIKKGEIYQIVLVEEVTTPTNKHYLRLTCQSKNQNDKRNYVEVLWLNDEVRETSAFGAFLSSFGSDTEDWIGKWFRVEIWESKQHKIYPVKVSKSKLDKEKELS